jgi:hypothetical protein
MTQEIDIKQQNDWVPARNAGELVSRRVVMNKMLAIPVITAIPMTPALTASPAIAGAPSASIHAATLARAEEVVDILRTRSIRKGWKIDEAAAERALAYCRNCAENNSYPDEEDSLAMEEEEAAISFFYSHGVSFDWVFAGDITGLICAGAHHSKRANDIADGRVTS